jgi:hypothetical protein
MRETQHDSNNSGNLLDNIRPFLKFLKRKFWLLVLTIAVGLGVGILFFYKQKAKYEAICTFILEEKSSGSGGLAGIASQFGLSLGGMSGGGIFAGDNILDILKSKKVVRKVLLSKVDSGVNANKTLADYFIDIHGQRSEIEKDQQFQNLTFLTSDDKLTPVQDSILNNIYDVLVEKHISTEKLSRQSTIIKVSLTSIDGTFSRLMTERLVKEASELYMDIRVGSAQENINKLQRRSDSLLALLNNRTYRAAASQPLDINPGIKTAIVPTEIANRDKTVLATLYAEVTKNLEASKLLLSQQTPVIQLLDTPGYLLDNNKQGLTLILIISVIASCVIFLGGLFVWYLINQQLGKINY